MSVQEVQASPTTRDALRTLPTAVRPILDGKDVVVPEGYEVQPVVAGLSFPTAIDVAEDGSLFVCEGGSTWPTRPYMPPRILRIDGNGDVEVIGVEVLGGPRGVVHQHGSLFVTVKGGYHTLVVKYDLQTRQRTVLFDKIPSGGWHEPGGPLFSPHDGLMYFAQGSIALNGIVEPAGFTVDMAKHPFAQDVPGQDVKLTGNNVWSRDPTAPFPFLAQTGPFKPFGVPASAGEVIKGQLWCSSGLWRAKPDGSEPELLAWGIRNPFGMAFNEDGELYVSDNDFEEKGVRAIAEDPDRVWHIRNARTPHGSIETPDWYGFPDICADGLPAWHENHIPKRGKAVEPLLDDPPEWAGPPAYLEKPHTCMTKMDFCRFDDFGYRGELFLTQFGTYAPLNTPDREALSRGFRVIRINVHEGTSEPFMHNQEPGPASAQPGSGGIERPVDCKFSPDGQSLYVLDFGVSKVTETHVVAYARTGALWRITRT